ncbi:MAG TPA: hypothetical protein VFU22_07995 [Roseiflexaceae bacterium]|nr:hypothetical protein [Roseiflexaceae bacterium]
MEIKSLALLGTPTKGLRGLVYQTKAYAAREPGAYVEFVAGIVLPSGTSIKAGQETLVQVTIPELSANANVSQIQATLKVVSGSATEPAKVSVKEGKEERTYELGVAAPVGLQNVTLRLDQGEVFWTHPGLLQVGEYTLPDFAEHVNTFLDRLPAGQPPTELRFAVKSDTDGIIDIRVDQIKVTLIQTQSWTNELDNSVRLDRNVQLDYNAIERLELDPIKADGKRLQRSSLKLDLGGQFGPDRLLGSVETHDGKQFATISSDFALAQRFHLDKTLIKSAISCTGMTGVFQTDGEAELYVEIQKDAKSAPAAGPPLVKANVPLAPANSGARQQWTFVRFEAPTDLQTDIPYWIVVKGVRGRVQLGLQPPVPSGAAPTVRERVAISRGGQVWRDLIHTPLSTARPERAPVEALLGLIYQPASDNQMAAVEVAIDGMNLDQPFDVGSSARTLTFDLAGTDTHVIALTFKSHAQGTLSIANVIQEYLLM